MRERLGDFAPQSSAAPAAVPAGKPPGRVPTFLAPPMPFLSGRGVSLLTLSYYETQAVKLEALLSLRSIVIVFS